MKGNTILLLAGGLAAVYLFMNRPGTSQVNPAPYPGGGWESISDIPVGTWVRDTLGNVGYSGVDEHGIHYIDIYR